MTHGEAPFRELPLQARVDALTREREELLEACDAARAEVTKRPLGLAPFVLGCVVTVVGLPFVGAALLLLDAFLECVVLGGH